MKISMPAADAPRDEGRHGESQRLEGWPRRAAPQRSSGRSLTNDAEDVPDAGHEYDEHIGATQEGEGDDAMPDPAEILGGAE